MNKQQQLEWEMEIGRRLRVFREEKMIPRTRLAVALSIGNERLASYESGRAPLPYFIFHELMHRFQVNPYWMATGESHPTAPAFDDSGFYKSLPRRAKFSDVYKKYMKGNVETKASEASLRVNAVAGEIRELVQMPASFWKSITPSVREEFQDALQNVLDLDLVSSGEKKRLNKAQKKLGAK